MLQSSLGYANKKVIIPSWVSDEFCRISNFAGYRYKTGTKRSITNYNIVMRINWRKNRLASFVFCFCLWFLLQGNIARLQVESESSYKERDSTKNKRKENLNTSSLEFFLKKGEEWLCSEKLCCIILFALTPHRRVNRKKNMKYIWEGYV